MLGYVVWQNCKAGGCTGGHFKHRQSDTCSYVRPTNRTVRPIRARCLMLVLPNGKTSAGGNAIMSFKHR